MADKQTMKVTPQLSKLPSAQPFSWTLEAVCSNCRSRRNGTSRQIGPCDIDCCNRAATQRTLHSAKSGIVSGLGGCVRLLICQLICLVDIDNSALTMTCLRLRSWVQVTVNAGACLLASSRWEPTLLGKPPPSEARLGCKLNVVLLVGGASALNSICILPRATIAAAVFSDESAFGNTFYLSHSVAGHTSLPSCAVESLQIDCQKANLQLLRLFFLLRLRSCQ